MKTINEKVTNLFLKEFDCHWGKMLNYINCHQIQLVQGNRLRPQICLWGYLANQSFKDDFSFDLIASVSVSI